MSRKWKRVAALALVGSTAGCGPEAHEPAELVERCGTADPVQLLPLTPREVVRSGSGGIALHEDRWLIGVHEYAIDVPAAQTYPQDGRGDAEVDARVVSVDACGEDAKVVAEGVADVRPPTAAGEPWLSCQDVIDVNYFCRLTTTISAGPRPG